METALKKSPKNAKKINNSKSNSNDEDKPKELITRDEVKDSPFTIIGTEGKFFGVVGQHRITKPMDTKEKVEAELSEITWNRIIQITMILIEKLK